LRIKHIPKIKWKMAIVTKENLKKDKEKQNRGLIKHQTKFKKGEQQAADLRNKARARVHETPEQTHERRAANLRSKARARIHETPEEAHERREANLRNVSDLSRRLIILWMK